MKILQSNSWLTSKINQCWVPVSDVNKPCTVHPTPGEHFTMYKPHPSDSSLPQCILTSSQRIVIAAILRYTSVVCAEHHNSVIPQSWDTTKNKSFLNWTFILFTLNLWLFDLKWNLSLLTKSRQKRKTKIIKKRMYFNPYYLTPRVFAKNACFGHFRDFRAKLAPIYSKRHLQNDSVPFCLCRVLRLSVFVRACAEIKISRRHFWTRKWPGSLGFSFF